MPQTVDLTDHSDVEAVKEEVVHFSVAQEGVKGGRLCFVYGCTFAKLSRALVNDGELQYHSHDHDVWCKPRGAKLESLIKNDNDLAYAVINARHASDEDKACTVNITIRSKDDTDDIAVSSDSMSAPDAKRRKSKTGIPSDGNAKQKKYMKSSGAWESSVMCKVCESEESSEENDAV